jgi:O-antigen ligase
MIMGIFDFLMVGIVFFAAFAWGANEAWAMGFTAMITLTLTAIKITADIWRRSFRMHCTSVFIPLFLFLAYVGSQLLFGPASGSSFPGTVERRSTTVYFLLSLSYVAIVFIVGNGARSRSFLKRLVVSILVLGAVESIYGLIQYIGNYNYIWQVRRITDVSMATGTLINRNHYALLMNVCICISLGYLYYRLMRITQNTGLSLRRLMSAPGFAKIAWIVSWIVLMGLALVFSTSRMGIAAMFFSMGAMMIAARITTSHARRTTAVVVFLILAILGSAIYIGVDALFERYESILQERSSDTDRIALWRDAWKLVIKYPVFGQGLGTFRWTYPAYESVQPDIPAQYAHNDYLQAVAELGVIGLALLLWAYGAFWRTAIRNIRNAGDPLVRGIGIAMIGALTAIALQEITDFGLYIPGVAVTVAFLAGLNIRASALASKPSAG